MTKLFQRLLAPLAAALALVAPGASPAKAPAAAKPALWAVSDHDTTIYLFGTIHLLPEKYQWRTAKFDEAVKGSNQLVVETIVDEKNPMPIVAALQSLGFSPGLPPLAQRVPASQRPALARAIAKSGVPAGAFDRMDTWAAAFMLLGNQFKAMGLQGGQGVEAVLRANFANDNKPIGELETNAEQLGYFDRLPESAQVALLEGAIMDTPASSKQFGGMLDAWSRGNVAGIAKAFDQDMEASPALKASLIRQRNANWSKWIEQRMQQPGTVMLAVGAGHLAGKDSVIAMLQKDGHTVRRVQ